SRPLAPPSIVRSPAARPPTSALRTMSAWSGPGIAIRTSEASANSNILACHHVPSDMSSSGCRTAAAQQRCFLHRELLVGQHTLVAQPGEALELAGRATAAPHRAADAGAHLRGALAGGLVRELPNALTAQQREPPDREPDDDQDRDRH